MMSGQDMGFEGPLELRIGQGAISAGFRRALMQAWMALLIVFTIPAMAHAQEVRIALVIGNAAYTDITPLKNPVNDARLMRDTLKNELGFKVIYVENADKTQMDKAIREFGARLADAGSKGVALFYYAGHGVQSSGQNFLLPLKTQVSREADLRLNAVRAEDVLSYMESAQSAVKIVILDACRDNPFAVRFRISNNSRGLADIALGNSEFTVAYAATAGNTAEDGSGANSPYAQALANRLPTPDAEIFDILRMVRIDVSNATRGRQLPEARTTLRREVYFNRTGGKRAKMVASVEPPLTKSQSRVATASPAAKVAQAPIDITGKWCQATRNVDAILAMRITDGAIEYDMVEGGKARFGVRSIQPNDDGNVEVRWLNRQVPMVFEFGEFSPDGGTMTQIRGRNEVDADWKTYDRRFRRC
jgi:uncharacterized caspase-like protein